MNDVPDLTKKPKIRLFSEDGLRAYAQIPALHKSQVVELIQGLPSARKISNDSCTYLEDYAEYVATLNQAERDGRISFPISPRHLVKFAVEADIPLSAPFVETVVSAMPRSSRPRKACQDNGEFVFGRDSNPRKGPGRPRRNRHKVLGGYDPKIVSLAGAFCAAYVAQRGRMPLRAEVEKAVHLKLGIPMATIKRDFSMKGVLSKAEFESARRKYRATRRDDW